MKYRRFFSFLLMVSLAIFFTSCESHQSIVNSIDEREANEIIVYLASKDIVASKAPAAESGAAAAAGGGTMMWNINVEEGKSTEAIAFLNQVGLPRRKGTNLLELFAKSGLMSSDKEETIRYQAGLEEQLKNTIRKIDGIIDAEVNISFPQEDTTALGGATEKKKVTAAIFVKHQGVMDDPNNHFETKIKRLVAGSIQNLDFENVAIISDRARFADITLGANAELISNRKRQNEYVTIWSMEMSKSSLARFRTIFFLFICLILVFGGLLGWLVYKNFPDLQKRGLFNWNIPFMKKKGERPPPGSSENQ